MNIITTAIKQQTEKFFRYCKQESNRRSNAFGFNFEIEEDRRFTDEVRRLQELGLIFSELLASNYVFPEALARDVALDQEVHYPSELSEEQLIWYVYRRAFFRRREFDRKDQYYIALYMLEIANMLEKSFTTPYQALSELFSFYDDMMAVFSNPDAFKKDKEALDSFKKQMEAYFQRLCLSFLTSHSETSKQLKDNLVQRDLYWNYDLFGEIQNGCYNHAAEFILRYAKGLKLSDLPHNKHVWNVMPAVFQALDQHFSTKVGIGLGPKYGSRFQSDTSSVPDGKLFRYLLLKKGIEYIPFPLLPINRTNLGQKRRIPLSETCYIQQKTFFASRECEIWSFTEIILPDAGKEFLAMIHLFTDSFIREYYGGPKRKRSVDRFIKKKFARSGEPPSIIYEMKSILMDPFFEKVIKDTVDAYAKQHPEGNKKKPSATKLKETLDSMDHEKPVEIQTIDSSKLKQAKNDAEKVLTLLHDGEIDYEADEVDPITVQADHAVKMKEEGSTAATDSSFSDTERHFLALLIKDYENDSFEAASYLEEKQLSPAMIMKDINQKALEVIDDVILVRKNGHITLIEDYIEEIKETIL